MQVTYMIKNVSTVNKLGSIVTEAMSDSAMACLYQKIPSVHFQIRFIGHECMAKVPEISDLITIEL
jgi:hypothetical protein